MKVLLTYCGLAISSLLMMPTTSEAQVTKMNPTAKYAVTGAERQVPSAAGRMDLRLMPDTGGDGFETLERTLPKKDEDDKEGSSSSAEKTGWRSRNGGFGGYQGGVMMGNMNDLVQKMDPNLPDVAEMGISHGGSGTLMINNFMFSGSGYGMALPDASDPAKTVSASASGGFFTFGYNVLNSDRFLLYPSLGIGGESMQFLIKETRTPTFQDVLYGQGTANRFSVRTASIRGSLGLLSSPIRAGGGFLIGLEAGYQYNFQSSRWQANGTDVSGGPAGQVSYIFFNLYLGGGGWNAND